MRTSKHAREAALGPWPTLDAMAGMPPLTLRWFHGRDIAAFGSDTSSDTYPAPVEGRRSPIHMGLLVVMNVHMLDNAYLKDFATVCARLDCWELMTTIDASWVPRATGMVVNPIAIF